MKVYDLAVIGTGMGGAMLASQYKQKDIIVFEKDSNLGGCASTFKRFNKYFTILFYIFFVLFLLIYVRYL